MLNMMEWWLCLAMESDEAEQVARFRELSPVSPAQRAMLLSARKEPRKYTEGAVLGAHFQALVRIVPPPLALAMTEPEEKAERTRLMRER